MADCGLANLGSCIVEKIFEHFLNLVNAPVRPFLDLTLNLLSEPINLNLFSSLWVIIVYCLSMFYALLIMYSGFNFIISGYDSAKRENAKSWLRNVIIMIILIQASFFLYQLVIDLSSSMTSAILSLVDQSFFTLGTNGFPDLGMSFLLGTLYITSLIITSFVLTIRYAVVAVGVALFPIAIFLYFIPPLKPYGSLIANFLGISIFVTFIDAVFLIGFSKLVNVGVFGEMKIFVLITAFLLISLLMLFLMFFSIIKSSISVCSNVSSLIAKIT
jgi:hypothetical protein